MKIVTTDVKHKFIIPPGETYQINSTSVRILMITAYDKEFRPIKINGEEFISLKSVAFNVKPVSRVFCVPSGELRTNFTEICEFVATMQVQIISMHVFARLSLDVKSRGRLYQRWIALSTGQRFFLSKIVHFKA